MQTDETTKTSETITITKDRTPKITSGPSKSVNNSTITLSGTAEENTLITITLKEQSLSSLSTSSRKKLSNMSTESNEVILKTVVTDKDGNWTETVTIPNSGDYVFLAYSNYGSKVHRYQINIAIQYQLKMRGFNLESPQALLIHPPEI